MQRPKPRDRHGTCAAPHTNRRQPTGACKQEHCSLLRLASCSSPQTHASTSAASSVIVCRSPWRTRTAHHRPWSAAGGWRPAPRARAAQPPPRCRCPPRPAEAEGIEWRATGEKRVQINNGGNPGDVAHSKKACRVACPNQACKLLCGAQPRRLTLVRIMAAPSAMRRRASPRSRQPHTKGTLKACLLMWCTSSEGVSTCGHAGWGDEGGREGGS